MMKKLLLTLALLPLTFSMDQAEEENDPKKVKIYISRRTYTEQKYIPVEWLEDFHSEDKNVLTVNVDKGTQTDNEPLSDELKAALARGDNLIARNKALIEEVDKEMESWGK